jgi:hypothetical protein
MKLPLSCFCPHLKFLRRVKFLHQRRIILCVEGGRWTTRSSREWLMLGFLFSLRGGRWYFDCRRSTSCDKSSANWLLWQFKGHVIAIDEPITIIKSRGHCSSPITHPHWHCLGWRNASFCVLLHTDCEWEDATQDQLTKLVREREREKKKIIM